LFSVLCSNSSSHTNSSNSGHRIAVRSPEANSPALPVTKEANDEEEKKEKEKKEEDKEYPFPKSGI